MSEPPKRFPIFAADPVYERNVEIKLSLLNLSVEELETKLNELITPEDFEDPEDPGGPKNPVITIAYRLYASKLDVRILRLLHRYRSILDLLPVDTNTYYSYPGIPRFLHTHAAAEGAVDVIRYLLEEIHVDVNRFYGLSTKIEKQGMLHHATRNGRIEVVEILLQHGADPSLVDGEGNTPAMYAVADNHIAIIDRLYFAGASFKNCFPKYRRVKVEIIVRLFDLRVLEGDDLSLIIALRPACGEQSYRHFFSVYNALYQREDGKQEAYRFLSDTFAYLYSRDQVEFVHLRELTKHFMAECLGSVEKCEGLRQVLLPYLFLHKAPNCQFNGVMEGACIPGSGRKLL